MVFRRRNKGVIMANANEELWALVWSGTSQPVVDVDAFMGYSMSDTAVITTYPVETGGFFSVNKWDNLYEATIEFGHAGDAQKLGRLITTLKAIKRSVHLVDLITPHEVLLNANIVSVDYEFSQRMGPRQTRPLVRIQEVRFIRASVEQVIVQFNSESPPKNAEARDTETSGRRQTSTLQGLWNSLFGLERAS